jgi:hypothetical protein
MNANEVRVRVWRSGYFQGNNFVSTSLPYLFLCTTFGSIDLGDANVGHVSIETTLGYLSVWPRESVAVLKTPVDAANNVSGDEDQQNEKRAPNVDKIFVVSGEEIHGINEKILSITKSMHDGKERYQFKPTTLADVSIANKGNCCTYAWAAYPKSQAPFFRRVLHDYGIKTPNSLAKTTTGSNCIIM